MAMDNLAAPKAEAVRRALDRAGLGYRHLPPYSPDLNPIEPCWSKLEGRLRAKTARSLEALEAELGPALAAITPPRTPEAGPASPASLLPTAQKSALADLAS